MIWSALLLPVLVNQQFESFTERDSFGVAKVVAGGEKSVWFRAGFAVAHDRLWQMENSRRVSQGKMAEVFGASFVNSDKEYAVTGYTPGEYDAQLKKLPAEYQDRFVDYAAGVNACIEALRKSQQLPPGYKKYEFEPEPWTARDSVAVCVRLLQQFGKGGAGEIRNLALFGYLKTQAKLKGKELDVFDDVAWFQDPEATCTISDRDDPQRDSHVKFVAPTRAQSLAHLAQLPNLTLFDLLPAVRLAEKAEQTRIAELVAAPYKVGSYCVVVSPKKSTSGEPILLSAPQMGWQTPSIVHEMTIVQKEGSVTGMDLPGVPGILIGHSAERAWGLTSGVADTEDIIYYPSNDNKTYRSYEGVKSFIEIPFEIKVKGGETVKVVQKRTIDGPVLLNVRGNVFARKSAFRNRELQSYESVASVPFADPATSPSTRQATMSFNFFWADAKGNIGYRYMGSVPERTPGTDPRVPIPGEKVNPWLGMIPFEKMPSVLNPATGFLTNWNNKPVSWWANGDTPVWGKVFRNSEILAALPPGQISTQNVEIAAWTIARRDEFWRFLEPVLRRLDRSSLTALGYDGWQLDDSTATPVAQAFVKRLREQLFTATVGGLVSPDYFQQALQPTLILRALEGRTTVNYLAGRKPSEVIGAALRQAQEDTKARPKSVIFSVTFGTEPKVPYMNRGTFMQIVEFRGGKASGRSMNMPGVAESGVHAFDQLPLGRAWVYKPMKL